MVEPLCKTVGRYLRKLNIELPYDPAFPLLGIYIDKTFLERDTCNCMFITSLFTIAETWKQPKCPSTDEWIKKMYYIHTMEYCPTTKKNKILPFSATWMELEILTLNEVSQKGANAIWCHLIWNLIYITNETFHRKGILGLGEQTVVAKREEEGLGWKWSLGLIDTNYCIWSG